MPGMSVTGNLHLFPPWVLLLLMVPLLGGVLKLFTPQIKGWLGEMAVNWRARHQLDPTVYHLIPNVMLPTPDGTTQIDHVIVSRYGIFVLETKTYKGWIFGGERDPQWTQTIYRRKERFQNPLRQNYKHIKTLAELTGIPEDYFKSMVLFVGTATFKTEMPENVMYGYQFVRYI